MAQQTLNTPRETTHQRIADALEDIVDKIVDTSSASNIDYDNTQSGLDADKVQGAVDELASEKVDKVEGKGLSTNDYTDAEKTKLAGIEAGAQVNTVTSVAGKTGAVSLVKGDVGLGNVDNTADLNKPISRYTQAALDEKTDISNFNALTQEIELFNTYDLTNDVEISVFANKTYKKDKYDDSHVPNLDGEYSVSLGDKTFTETCTFTIANEGKSITETFHTNRKYILGAKLLKAENDEVGDAHVIADVVTLLISKDAPYTTTFDPDIEQPPVTGVLTLKVSVKPDEKYVNEENTGGPAEYAYWGSYNGSDLLINNPILTYSETTFGQPKVSGNPITINDAAEANAVDVSVEIEPVQDLHGYDHPWVGGAGKNKFDQDTVYASYKQSDGSFRLTANNAVGIKNYITQDLVNKQLTFSVYVDLSKETSPNYIRTVAEVGGSLVNGTDVSSGNKGYISVTFTPTSTDDFIYFTYGSGGNNYFTMKDLMLEVSSARTTFEPYSNICPISGWDECNVTRTGKNLFGGAYNEYFPIHFNEDKIVIASADVPSEGTNPVQIAYYDKNKTLLDYWGLSTQYSAINNRVARSFTLPKEAYYLRYITQSSANYQIEFGETNSAYEPYNGQTYTIDLDGTRYGGTLDVVNGVLTVDRVIIDLGSCAWDVRSESVIRCAVSAEAKFESQYKAVNGICSAYIIVAQNSLGDGKLSFNNSTQIYLQDNSHTFSTQSDAQQYLNGQKLVYELATPTTIQLTPQQIRLLKGTNNISCNTGDLSIKYYPDNVLGQLKGDIEGEYDERVETLETQVQELQPSLIFMSRERRDITSDLSRLSTAVAEQNLEKYGYKIGDYFERVDGNRTYTYHIADYNTFKGTSTPYCLTTNHIGIVVDTHATTQWYSGDASAVGYNGSTLHTYLKGTVLDNIKADMIYFFGGTTGLEHLLSHSKLLTTALANWGWQANQYISALSEVQTIGSVVWGANGYQTGEASKKLEIFNKYKWTEIFEGRYPWLRDMQFASYACLLNNYGNAYSYGVTYAFYVFGLIIFY